jgi:transcriptional regulator with XRE-family HTH domain
MYGGKKLKQLRQYLGLGQQEVATILNVSQPYYSAIERGKKPITNKLLEEISLKFEIDKEYFSSSTLKPIQEYKGVRTKEYIGGNSGGLNSEAKNNQVPFYTGYFEENKIDFYYRHPENSLNKLLSVAIDELKSSYNDYHKLINISINFGQPDFMKEKFNEKQDFKGYKKQLDADLLEDHNHITDQKLLKCFRLIAYQQNSEDYSNSLSQLIFYMDKYQDMYKGYIHPNIFQ